MKYHTSDTNKMSINVVTYQCRPSPRNSGPKCPAILLSVAGAWMTETIVTSGSGSLLEPEVKEDTAVSSDW